MRWLSSGFSVVQIAHRPDRGLGEPLFHFSRPLSVKKRFATLRAGPGPESALFLDLGQDVAGPGEAFNERAKELAVEAQLAGIGQLFKLHVLDPQQLHL